MNGFEIAQLQMQDALQRIEELKDSSILPMDDEGAVLDADEIAVSSAREIRLLLQRILDLDVHAFLNEMRRLFFHLFAVDHDHYQDLLFQAARRDPVATREFALELILHEGVLFIDDQKTLHGLFELLELLGVESLPPKDLDRLRQLFSQPFFRVPSVHARLIRFLAPVLQGNDLANVRRLFEMDLVDPKVLTWNFALPAPAVRPADFSSLVTLRDFEDLHWAVGIEGTLHTLSFRMLGSLLAAGPSAAELFLEICESQPETAFRRHQFETRGQEVLFRQGLETLRSEVLREAHRSGDWFVHLPVEKNWPWAPPAAPDPWPAALRFLPYHWTEFADPTDESDFARLAAPEIQRLDDLAEKIALLLKKGILPTREQLEEGENLQMKFALAWQHLLSKALPHLEVLP